MRPDGGLVDVALSAYPSGHAAYAVAFIACATVLVRAGVGWALRFAVVTVAVVVVVVGRAVARVPARALPHRRARRRRDGARDLGLVGIVALFAGRVRQNGVPST